MTPGSENQILMLMIYSFIAVAAFLGNSLVVYVLITRPTYLKHAYNIFIFSLAITDVTTSIFLIIGRYIYLPPLPEGSLAKWIYCRFVWGSFLLFSLVFISVYTAMALTIERWLAVVKPLVYRSIKLQHTMKAVAIVWIWPLLTNLATLWRVKFDKMKGECVWIPLKVANDELPWAEIALQTVIPSLVMTVLYGHILYKIRKLAKTNAAQYRKLKGTTIVVFVACTGMLVASMPSRITFMLSKVTSFNADGKLHSSLNIMMLSNSAVNPILYGIYHTQLRKEYRVIFRNVLDRFKRSPRNPQRPREGQTADTYL